MLSLLALKKKLNGLEAQTKRNCYLRVGTEVPAFFAFIEKVKRIKESYFLECIKANNYRKTRRVLCFFIFFVSMENRIIGF